MRAWLVSLTNASRLCVPPQPALPAGAAKAGGSASNESDTRVMRQNENARRQAGTGGILRGCRGVGRRGRADRIGHWGVPTLHWFAANVQVSDKRVEQRKVRYDFVCRRADSECWWTILERRRK